MVVCTRLWHICSVRGLFVGGKSSVACVSHACIVKLLLSCTVHVHKKYMYTYA